MCNENEHNYIKVREQSFNRKSKECGFGEREHYTEVTMVCTKCGHVLEVEVNKYIVQH